MEYTKKDQEAALKMLVKKEPHNIEAFKKLHEISQKNNYIVEINLREILFSQVWNTQEKIDLIRLYGHNDINKHVWSRIWDYKTYDNDYDNGIEGLPLIDECIKRNNYTGVEALLKLNNHISVGTISRIIEHIKDPKERYKYCKLIIEYSEKENVKAYEGTGNQCNLVTIPTLCDRYPLYDDFSKRHIETISSMKDICNTNDIELVKLFLPTIKDINKLFMYAVDSKNVEIARLFIEKGADVNYEDLEFIYEDGHKAFRTPVQIAIDNNDLEMLKLLHQNGANLNFVYTSEKIQEHISKLGTTEEEKKTHQYKWPLDKIAYITWTKTPLEYAIKKACASIIDLGILNYINEENKEYKNIFENRIKIVNYLYQNNAKFSNNEINYTDLICFAIKSDSYEATKYYFEEAFKNNQKVDFEKIISFIHSPGIITKNNSNKIYYDCYPEDAIPWLELCEEYSNKLDSDNYQRNIKLMLEKIFDEFLYYKYKEIIKKFSQKLPKTTLKDIPAVFGVPLDEFEEVMKLGYGINAIKNGENILMNYIKKPGINLKAINKLIELGVNQNYQNPVNGENALSYILYKLEEFDFSKYIRIFDKRTKQLYNPAEKYEKDRKDLVKRIIELVSEEIVKSESVKKEACNRITPGYSQIIYNELLYALTQKGFTVDDDYFTNSIAFLNKQYSDEYINNQWEYLWNLYQNFSNRVVTNFEFPKVEDIKKHKKKKEYIFTLIQEHLKRNFALEYNDVKEPDEFDIEEEKNNLEKAQDKLLEEMARYVGFLTSEEIISLIDKYPILDNEAIIRNKFLGKALDKKEKLLCEELIKRGITIITYNEQNQDITSRLYSQKQINYFQKLTNYNPKKATEDLFEQITRPKTLTLKPEYKN